MSRQDNCELRRYNTLSISNSNFANALQAERICCECLPCPEIVQWLCPIGNEACVTPCAAAYSQFIRSYSQLFRTSTRARRVGDIDAVFGGGVEVVTVPGRDYRFRAFIARRVIADTIASRLFHIDYGNFKGSVKDDALHDAYMKLCGVMADLLEIPSYGTEPRKGKRAQ
jgi:hypothetical protein